MGQGRLDDLVIGTSRRPGLPDRPGRPHARPATPARSGPRTRRTAPASAMPPAETAASASSPDWPACVTAASSPAPGSSWERQDLQLTRGFPGAPGCGFSALRRVDADQHRCRHPVRDATDRSRQPGHQVRVQVPPLRPYRAQSATGRPQPKAGELCSPAGFPSGRTAQDCRSVRRKLSDASQPLARSISAAAAPGRFRSSRCGKAGRSGPVH